MSAHCNCISVGGKGPLEFPPDGQLRQCGEPPSWRNPRYPDGLFCGQHKVMFEWATEWPWERVQ